MHFIGVNYRKSSKKKNPILYGNLDGFSVDNFTCNICSYAIRLGWNFMPLRQKFAM